MITCVMLRHGKRRVCEGYVAVYIDMEQSIFYGIRKLLINQMVLQHIRKNHIYGKILSNEVVHIVFSLIHVKECIENPQSLIIRL